MTAVPVEEDLSFRLARLTLLLVVAEETDPDGLDVERLGVYDFLAAHPLLMASDDNDPDRLRLLLAGFDDRALAYASPTQRFVTGQLRLPRDLAILVAYGLATYTANGRIRYRPTNDGQALVGQFTALYAHSYTAAARIVVGRLRRLSGRKLRENMREWLRIEAEPRPGRLDPADVIDLDPHPQATSPGSAWRTGFLKDET
jgi:hypothetical protein